MTARARAATASGDLEAPLSYDLANLNAPRLAGWALRAFVAALESPLGRSTLVPRLFEDNGFGRLSSLAGSFAPTVGPSLPRDDRAPAEGAPLSSLDTLVGSPDRAPVPTVADWQRAYREGLDPREVARRVTAACARLDAADPPLRALVEHQAGDLAVQAEASAARWAAGRPLGPLDGVPVAVKDELDQAGYRTRVGTSFLGKEPAATDATVVARLRAQGALLFGKAGMHEVGIGTTGLNVHYGTPRNPYDPRRHTGGSSSGSAAAVAAGLGPLAIGADGGGSIRIPAALCGVFGLKATWGRISEHGAAPLCWSVAHVGPLAASAADLALAYAVMAGPDPLDPNTRGQPALGLGDLGDVSLAGVRLGIYRPWFEDADPEVGEACRALVDQLVARGARRVEVTVPELEACRLAHTTSIVCEMGHALLPYWREDRTRFSLEVRANLAIAQHFRASDYLAAQQIRARVTHHLQQVYADCDLLVTPTTACTAPLVRLDALRSGESNLPLVGKIMRFAPLANLSGYPAVSVPAGYDRHGLPIGLQAMGRPWAERLLLAFAAAAEREVPRRRPQIEAKLLG